MVETEDKQLPTTSEDKTKEQKTSANATTEPVVNETKSGSGYFTLILLIIVATAAAAGGFYLWQQQQILIKNQLATSEDLAFKLRQIKTQENSKVDTLKQGIESNKQLLNYLASDQKQMVDISQKAIEVSNRGQKGWILAEIDYLLRIANRRLQIARDTNGAIAALQGANQRIYDLGDLTLFNIRQQLSKDIAQLKALHKIDVNGAAMAIDQMIDHLSDLPFKSVEDEVKAQFKNADTSSNIEAASESTSDDFIDSVINTVMKIGEIKVHHRSLEVASNAKQQDQLEQILRTHLLGARLAVLRYDQKQFAHDIQQSQQILHLHYKENDNRISQIQSDLSGFSNLNLMPDLPDITKSWVLLQAAIQSVKFTDKTQQPEKEKTKPESAPQNIKEAEAL
jgi:uroporphyrin-III C-methyltransferase